MSQIFHPAANAIARVSIVAGGLAAAVVAALVLFVLPRSSYVTRQHEAREQPVPFCHEHHVGSMGIDCRYCHTSVEKSALRRDPADRRPA